MSTQHKKIDTDWTDKAGLHLEGASSLLSILHDAIERNLVTAEERRVMIDNIMDLLEHSCQALITESKDKWTLITAKIHGIVIGLKVLKTAAERSADYTQSSSAFALGFLVDETLSLLERKTSEYLCADK